MKKIISVGKFILLVIFALALTTVVVGCSGDDGFKVSQVQHDPFAFPGEITIDGTVAMFSDADPALFGVMDTDELLQCGRFDCGAWIMPTTYLGAARPTINVGDNVTLTGEFVRAENMVVFQVSDMSVGNNIMNRLP